MHIQEANKKSQNLFHFVKMMVKNMEVYPFTLLNIKFKKKKNWQEYYTDFPIHAGLMTTLTVILIQIIWIVLRPV